jgi:hypothetical protein
LGSKLRIKIGAVELEYEGQTEFSIEAIKDLFGHLEVLSQSKTVQSHAATVTSPAGNVVPAQGSSSPLSLHTNTMAAKLSVRTGPELAFAAAAHIQMVEQKPSFSRSDLAADMKTATSYYKKSMLGNLTPIIEGLVKAGNSIKYRTTTIH